MISLRVRRRILLAATSCFVAVPAAFAVDTTIPSGTTQTTQITLSGTDTLTVDSGGAITTASSPSVVLSGASPSLTIDNSGNISSTAGRAIRTSGSSGSFSLTLTNRAGALIEGTDDALGINRALAGGTVVIDNYGTIRSTTDGQALDLNPAVGGTVILNNNGVIEANGTSDVVRPGANATVTNYDTIRSMNDGVWDGSEWDRGDAVDFQSAGGGTVYNLGTIEGAKHGITGDIGTGTFEIQNYAFVTGRNGSGINLDIPDDATDEEIAALSTVHVINSGLIIGAATDLSEPEHWDTDGDGIDIDYLANIENYGGILALGALGNKDGNPDDPNISDGISIGGGSITNHDGAYIYSVGRAILVDDSEGGSAYAATQIINAGGITSEIGQAITLRGEFADYVENSGTIVGAVDMGGGNDMLQNSGTIDGDVAMAAGDNTVDNSGWIAGNVDLGYGYVILNNSGTIEGSVQSTTIAGAYTNSGTIGGDVFGGSYLDNSGTIGGLVSIGEWVATFQNSGSIAGDVYISGSLIADLGNSGSIGGDVFVGPGVGFAYNSGSIGGDVSFAPGLSAVAGSARIFDNSGGIGGNVIFQDQSDLLTNTGSIAGGVDMGSGGDELVNSGTIGGGVYFGSSYENTLTNSGSIGGDVWIGYADVPPEPMGPIVIPEGIEVIELDEIPDWWTEYSLAGSQVTNSGSIGGDVTFGYGSDILLNAGTIGGNVAMGDGDDTVGLQKLIGGTLDGGMGDDDLIVGGAGTGVWTLSGVTNFETLDIIAGNWTFGDDQTYEDGVTVRSGVSLAVNTALGAVATIEGGATLSGSGSVAGLEASVGAVIVPGNGTSGTLAVNGDASLDGVTMRVGMAANGASNQLDVSGTAEIDGGTVVLDLAPGPYVVGSKATIVQADGGISGSGFSSLQAPSLLFITPTLGMDANSVTIALDRNGVPFATFAQTANQRAVANALDQSYGGSRLYDTIASSWTSVGLAESYDSLSGEIHADLAGTLLDQSVQTELTLLDRLRQIGVPGKTATPNQRLGYGEETPTNTAAFDALAAGPRYSGWTQAFGSWLNRDGDGNAATTDSSVGGALVGADFSNDSYTFGLAGGYSWGSADTSAWSSSADIETGLLAIYGGYAFDAVKLRGGASMGWSSIDTSRVAMVGGMIERPQANYNATTGNLFGELAYDAKLGAAIIEPYAGLGYVSVSGDSFSETNAPLTGLSSSGVSYETAYSTLGARFSTEIFMNGSKLTPRAMIGWRHAFDDVPPEAAMVFNDTGTGFTVAGTPIAQDSLLLEAGADFAFNEKVSIGFTYAGSFADNAEANTLKLNGEVRF